MVFSPRIRAILTASGAFLIGLFLLVGIENSGILTGALFDGGGLSVGLDGARNALAGTGVRGDTSLITIIASVISTVLPLAGAIAVFAFVVSGFIFILGFGSDTAVQRARKIMIWSATGILVIMFAYPIVLFIINLGSNY